MGCLGVLIHGSCVNEDCFLLSVGIDDGGFADRRLEVKTTCSFGGSNRLYFLSPSDDTVEDILACFGSRLGVGLGLGIPKSRERVSGRRDSALACVNADTVFQTSAVTPSIRLYETSLLRRKKLRVIMASGMENAYARPPFALRDVYKRLQRSKSITVDEGVVNDEDTSASKESPTSSARSPRAIFEAFTGTPSKAPIQLATPETCEVPGKAFLPTNFAALF